MYYFFLTGILISLDQITKYFIQTNMDLNKSVPVVEGIFHITYIHNYGAAFSILQGKQIVLIGVTLIAIAAVLTYMFINRKSSHWSLMLSLAFIAGGGIGNLINRIRVGYVVDFLDFRFFPIFNIADICVCCGAGLLIIYMFYFEPRIKRLETYS